jgi:hypothetical protein
VQSGEPFFIGGNRLGPLASGGVSSIPLGWAHIFGKQRPDLFVGADKWYPGIFLYCWLDDDDGGVPVFGNPIRVNTPFSDNPQPKGTVFETADGNAYGFWLEGTDVIVTRYVSDEQSFIEEKRIALSKTPRKPGSIGVLLSSSGCLGDGYEILLGINDGSSYQPDGPSRRYREHQAFDGAGVWRGALPRAGLYAANVSSETDDSVEVKLISEAHKEAHAGYNALYELQIGGNERCIVGGSRFGTLYIYAGGSVNLERPVRRNMAVGIDGRILRHPSVRSTPSSYPGTDGSDLIVGGECALYYYKYTGTRSDSGDPMYDAPRPVLERNAKLYTGSLPVVNVVDWDGDGLPDIISGNSEGRILFFRNIGTPHQPSFLPGQPLCAGGREIHVQPGYGEDIQGPWEARWGYTCPTVADWNGDGLPDILMCDSTGRHTVFLNYGTPTQPVLDEGHPLYLDGLDLHGMWRVKPGVADLGGRMAYVILDDDDEYHLYWRIDDYNVEDGEKLRLEDGSPIRGNALDGGGAGRHKINLYDWNGDGLIDMIIGTPRYGSIPNPDIGLPQSLGLPGAAILFLQNVGTNREPVFRFPELVTHQGSPIHLGVHSCGPTPTSLFGDSSIDLVSGCENGWIYYYAGEYLQPGR